MPCESHYLLGPSSVLTNCEPYSPLLATFSQNSSKVSEANAYMMNITFRICKSLSIMDIFARKWLHLHCVRIFSSKFLSKTQLIVHSRLFGLKDINSGQQILTFVYSDLWWIIQNSTVQKYEMTIPYHLMEYQLEEDLKYESLNRKEFWIDSSGKKEGKMRRKKFSFKKFELYLKKFDIWPWEFIVKKWNEVWW